MVRRFASLRFSVLLFSVLLLWSGTGWAFDPPGLGTDAAAYEAALRAKAPPQPNPKAIAEALKQADAALARREPGKVVTALEKAIHEGGERFSLWLRLSDAWTAGPANDSRAHQPKRALEAAFLAYRAAKAQQSAGDKGDESGEDPAVGVVEALKRAADLLETVFNQPRQALDAVDEALRQASQDAGLQQWAKTLRQKVGLSVIGVRADPESDPPRICLKVDGTFKPNPNLRYADFIRLEPAETAVSVTASESEVCVSGVHHGLNYRVTLRQGIASEEGLTLKQDVSQSVRVGDRRPWLGVRGNGGFILTRDAEGGVPVSTINRDAVAVTVYRINDRNLAGRITREGLLQPLYADDAAELEENSGERIWKGQMAVRGERNRLTTTGLAIRQIIPDPKPGLYVVVLEPVDAEDDGREYDPADDGSKATQWLMITDLGLTSMAGADGINVFARSFTTAQPLAGVDVRLIARNNAELGRGTTDPQGQALFPAGLVRGSGGNAPVAVMAYGADGDFAMQDLTATAFDLSDRGVGGRVPPGPMDAFLYTDRGVYRPGETVNLAGLLRNEATDAVGNFPLTLKVIRPGGTEFRSLTLTTAPAGGFAQPLVLSRTAPLGGWRVEAYADPKGEPVGELSFRVEEFVPERLAVTLTASAPILRAGQPFAVVATTRFLYGPPAAGLEGTADVTLALDPDPYPSQPGYHFGLVQETLNARQEELSFPVTDAAGVSRVEVSAKELPDTTRALRATFQVAVQEPGGRPTRQSLVVPVRLHEAAIGIRPTFAGGRIDDHVAPAFDLIAVAPDGSRLARAGLRYRLIAEKTVFTWYRQGNRYLFRSDVREQRLREGSLDIGAETPTRQEFEALSPGRYRLEVSDPKGRIASSVRFASGWQVLPQASEVPDAVEVVPDRRVYGPGESARVRITPPFAGEVLLTVATDRLWETRAFSVPKEGAEVSIPINPAWGPGAYVTATVFRPPVRGQERVPARAIGLTWLGVDPGSRSLNVTVEAPAMVRPSGPVEVTVQVAAAHPGPALENAVVTLAAVDEGILQLTDFVSPDPVRHYFAKRLLGVDIRDDYGRLLTPVGDLGALRVGGDSGGEGLSVLPFTLVSLFSGPVDLDGEGKARIPLSIPDYNGELRLMAVAHDRSRIGAAARPLTVRAPLVAEMTTARFLAPGDESRLSLSLHAVDAPAGPYRVAVRADAPLAVENGVQTLTLATGERRELILPLKGVAAGIGHLTLTVEGPEGLSLTRQLALQVRPSRPAVTQFEVRQLEPKAGVSLGGGTLAPYVPGTGAVSLTLSSAPPFNVAGMLRALDRYPYGCLEQLVSRALPLLAVQDVNLALGRDRRDEDSLESRVDQAISQVLDLQRFDGAFGVWNAYGQADLWLSAYAVEFLVRARDKGRPVPEEPLRQGLEWLRRQAVGGDSDAPALAGRAYALHVLASAGIALHGPTRYLHDAFLDHLPTPLARTQLALTLIRLGDQDRARVALAAAFDRLTREPWAVDYGSTVRDAAAMLALLGESGTALSHDRLTALLARLPGQEVAVERTSTQEQAWLVLAAQALLKGSKPLSLSVGGQAVSRDPFHLLPDGGELARGVTVQNTGGSAIWQALSVQGVPLQPPPAQHEGLRIRRKFFQRDGSPLNLDALRQNTVFVVLLEGEASTKLRHQALVTHALPAGWEIETPLLGAGEVAGMPWLGVLSQPQMAAARDDRYVAAVELTPEEPQFRLAYRVRAITPGNYELPGAVLEDMYKPRFVSRQAVGRIAVLPAE